MVARFWRSRERPTRKIGLHAYSWKNKLSMLLSPPWLSVTRLRRHPGEGCLLDSYFLWGLEVTWNLERFLVFLYWPDNSYKLFSCCTPCSVVVFAFSDFLFKVGSQNRIYILGFFVSRLLHIRIKSCKSYDLVWMFEIFNIPNLSPDDSCSKFTYSRNCLDLMFVFHFFPYG